MRFAICALILCAVLRAEEAVKPPKPPPEIAAEFEAAATRVKEPAPKSKAKVAADAADKTEEEKIKDQWKEKGFTPLKNLVFAFKDFKAVSDTFGYVTFVGQMANVNKDYKVGATFTLSAYDAKGELLNTDKFHIMNFDKGVKSFKTMMKIDLQKMKNYDIQFEQGY